MTRWEYQAVKMRYPQFMPDEDEKAGELIEAWLNEFGWEGWELVSIDRGDPNLYATFKRPIEEET